MDSVEDQKLSVPPEKKKTRHLSRNIFLALIALVLLLIVSNGFLGVNAWETNRNLANATATIGASAATSTAFAQATIHTNRTVMANAHATASAIPFANATATAIKAASQYPFSYTRWRVDDVFSTQHTNNDNWDENSKCSLTSQGYLVTVSNSKAPATCFARNSSFSNFTYEMHFQIIQGDCGGILFRANEGETSYYTFMICQDGSYVFVSSVNGSLINASRAGRSPLIHQGLKSIYTIGIVARGNMLSFYVYKNNNPTLMIPMPVIDNSYSQGLIGVIVNSLHNETTQVLFLGAKVWAL